MGNTQTTPTLCGAQVLPTGHGAARRCHDAQCPQDGNRPWLQLVLVPSLPWTFIYSRSFMAQQVFTGGCRVGPTPGTSGQRASGPPPWEGKPLGALLPPSPCRWGSRCWRYRGCSRGAPPDALRCLPHSPASSYFLCRQSRSLPWLLHPSAPPLSRRLPVSSQVRAAVPEHTSLQSWGPRPACQSLDCCPPCQPLCPVAESAPSPPHCPQEGAPQLQSCYGGVRRWREVPAFQGLPQLPAGSQHSRHCVLDLRSGIRVKSPRGCSPLVTSGTTFALFGRLGFIH